MRSMKVFPRASLTLLVSFATLSAIVSTAAPARAVAPSNDDFDTPTVVGVLPFTDPLDTTEATRAADDPSCAGDDGSTVWYSFTATEAVRIVADTFGSDYDTTLSGFAGDRGSLTQLACNDDAQGLQSRIALDVAAGESVSVMAGSFGGGLGGNLVIHMDIAPPPAANDDFDDATIIAQLPFIDAADLSAATLAADDPTCGDSVDETIWYSFAVPQSMDGAVVRATTPEDLATVSAYAGTRGALDQIACNPFPGDPWRIQLTLTAGQTVFFMVAAFDTAFVEFSLDLAPPPPANDDIADAASIETLPFSDTQDASLATSAAGDPSSECSLPGDPPFSSTLWYRYTATHRVMLDVGTPDSDFLAILSAFDESGTSLVPITCGAERMRLDVDAGQTVLVMVGGYPEAFDDLVLTADVARPLSAGDLDPAFGGDGHVEFRVGEGNCGWPNDVVVLGSGRIIGAGPICLPERDSSSFGLIGLLSDGRLDPAFGDRGVVTTNFGDETGDLPTAMAAQPDGKIVVAGESLTFFPNSSHSIALARYLPDGTLDPSFGEGGKVLVPAAVSVSNMLVQPDGRIVVLGAHEVCDPDLTCTFDGIALARFTRFGMLDRSFGDQGLVTTLLGITSFPNALTLQPRGRIVVGAGIDGEFLLTRYYPSGTVDPSFGGGFVRTAFPSAQVSLAALAAMPGGRIVALGTVRYADQSLFALSGYRWNGSLDPWFGFHGRRVIGFGPGSQAFARDLAVQGDGKIIAVGHVWPGPDGFYAADIGVVRLSRHGWPDPSFGALGRAIGVDAGAGSAVALQSDGKIVVAGCNEGFECASDAVMASFARFLAEDEVNPRVDRRRV
jgi:uncharacterized delta-60 repeat protein